MDMLLRQQEENGGLLATNNLAVPKEQYTRRSLDENSGKNARCRSYYHTAVSHPSFLHLFEPKLTDKLEMSSEQRK